MSKVALIRKPFAPHAEARIREGVLMLTQALPFYRRGLNLVHRVRNGHIFYRDGKYSHTSITFWCGNNGSLGNNRRGEGGALFENPPENAIHCATCEGRATGAGLNGARIICGRYVLYQPRI